jgi:heat shock protein HtpX
MDSTFRTFMLMTVLTVVFVLVGGALGGRQGAVIAFLVAGVMNFFSYWFSDKMVLNRYRAQEVQEANNPRLYHIVSDLSVKANLPMPKIYLIPERTPNAFATGRNPSHAAVAATQGIMDLLDDDELAGVMAHELTHVKNRDILTATIAATFAGAIAMLSQFARFGRYDQKNRNPLGMILVLVGAPLAAMLIRMAISRVREFAADRGGAEITRRPLSLADALNKLSQGVQRFPLQRGNAAHSHLFTVNPFFGGLQNLFATHPPLEDRIRRLQEMAAKGI